MKVMIMKSNIGMTIWLLMLSGVTMEAIASTATLETSGYSSYVNRGRTIDDEAVIQPSLTVLGDFAHGTLLGNAWANAMPDNKGNDDTFNEIDLTLEYGRTIANNNLSIGIIEYAFSDPELKDTHEVYLGVNRNIPLNLNVFSTIYYDCRAADGYYVMVGIKHLLSLGQKTALTSDTAIGYADSKYNEYYFTIDKAALNDWSSGVTINHTYTEKIGFVMGLRYMTLIDDKIRDGSSEYFLGRDMIIGRVGMILTF